MTDNNSVTCAYTGKTLDKKDAIKCGGFTGAGEFYYAKDASDMHRDNRKAFDACERNCNTCVFLERIKHPKDTIAGFLQGKCKSTPINHPYQDSFKNYDGNMIFHPNDPMHMKCYKGR